MVSRLKAESALPLRFPRQPHAQPGALNADLIDTIELMVFPVISGKTGGPTY